MVDLCSDDQYVQEAVRDLDRACGERNSLALQLTSKSRSLRLLEKRCRAQDRELAQLRRDSGTKCVREAELKAANRACHAQVWALPDWHTRRTCACMWPICDTCICSSACWSKKLHSWQQIWSAHGAVAMRHSSACGSLCRGARMGRRNSSSSRLQKLVRSGSAWPCCEHTRPVKRPVTMVPFTIQELELKLDRMAGSHAAAQLHGFISCSEHVRLLEARLATQAAEASAHLHQQLNRVQATAEART